MTPFVPLLREHGLPCLRRVFPLKKWKLIWKTNPRSLLRSIDELKGETLSLMVRCLRSSTVIEPLQKVISSAGICKMSSRPKILWSPRIASKESEWDFSYRTLPLNLCLPSTLLDIIKKKVRKNKRMWETTSPMPLTNLRKTSKVHMFSDNRRHSLISLFTLGSKDGAFKNLSLASLYLKTAKKSKA